MCHYWDYGRLQFGNDSRCDVVLDGFFIGSRYFFRRSEAAFGIHPVYEFFSPVFFENRKPVCRVHIVLVYFNHPFGDFPVGGQRIVFEEIVDGFLRRTGTRYRSNLHEFYLAYCFHEVPVDIVGAGHLRYCRIDFFKRFSVCLFTALFCVDPLGKLGFFGLLALYDSEFGEGLVHAYPFFPPVGGTCILACILDFYFRVGEHVFHDDFLAFAPYVDADCIVDVPCHFEFRSGHVPVGRARETYNHCVVPFLYAFEGDCKMSFRSERNIVLGVFRRVVVLVCIYAEHREITGMARPHPVVGIGPEFSYRGRRCADEADVLECFGNYQIICVVIVEALHSGIAVRVLGNSLSHKPVDGCLYCRVRIHAFLCGGLACFFDVFRHVRHAFHKGYGKAFARQFLIEVHCPVAVVEVVVLDGAQFLDAGVAAVVVRHQEPVRRDDFPGTSSAELYDGILQGSVVDAVNVFGAQFEAHFLHRSDVHFLEQREQPHSFVSYRRSEGERECCN